MQEYRDGILLFNLTEEKVWDKATQDSLGLEQFYRANKENYMWGERIEADVVILNDPAMEAEIRPMITRAAAKKQSLSDIGLDTLDGVFVQHMVFSKGDNPYIDAIEWKEGHTETRKLTEFNELYDGRSHNENSVVMGYIYELREPEPKSLDEARGLVTSDYQTFLEEQWVKELKEKYSIEVDEEVFEDIR